jgi:DNA replication protein DnaC
VVSRNPAVDLLPLAPGYTPRQAEIDAEMVALGRPTLSPMALMATLRSPAALNAHREAVEAWEHANPDAAVRWLELRVQARAEEARLFEERYGEAAYQREQLRVAGFEQALVERAAAELAANACFVAARDWLRDGTMWSLVLMGPPGCGKTQAATWAAFQLLTRTNFAPRCVRCPKASELPLYGAEAEEYRWRAATAGMLLLDDLGEGEQRNEKRVAWRAWVDDVLTQRHAARLKTVITTNRTGDELKAWLGERLVDRLREGVIHSTKEPSMRGAK